MKRKLLNKTLNAYLLISLAIALVAAPLFYIAIEHFYLDETDETLELRRKEFSRYQAPDMKAEDIATWNRMNYNARIEDTPPPSDDSTFSQKAFDPLENEDEPFRVLRSPVIIEGKTYTFSTRVNLVEAKDLIASIAWLFFGVTVASFLGFYLITRRLSMRLWQPFYSTLEQMEQFEIDKLHLPGFEETDVAEFQRLNDSVKKLIERNVQSYKSQREFIENAAHELQTPLAVFQAKLDTLMQQPELTESQSEILLRLTEYASRLNRLNKNLLLLSKIDSSQYPDKEQLSLKNSIDKQFDFFTEQAAEKNISIDLQVTGDTQLVSNAVLLEILWSNLLLNAIKHNTQNGQINILLEKNRLIISNTGSEALVSGKLFQRFSKQAAASRGSGLGLAIVKKIAELNGWQITYSFENNMHRFAVKF